jgi:hypothetical protein
MAEKMQRLHNSAYAIFRELCTGEVRRNPQPVEKLLYAPSKHSSRTQKPRHRSVLALMSKCLNAVWDYPPVL